MSRFLTHVSDIFYTKFLDRFCVVKFQWLTNVQIFQIRNVQVEEKKRTKLIIQCIKKNATKLKIDGQIHGHMIWAHFNI